MVFAHADIFTRMDTREAFDYAKAKLMALDYDQNPQMSADIRIRLTKVR
jgi:hypothetical protein